MAWPETLRDKTLFVYSVLYTAFCLQCSFAHAFAHSTAVADLSLHRTTPSHFATRGDIWRFTWRVGKRQVQSKHRPWHHDTCFTSLRARAAGAGAGSLHWSEPCAPGDARACAAAASRKRGALALVRPGRLVLQQALHRVGGERARARRRRGPLHRARRCAPSSPARATSRSATRMTWRLAWKRASLALANSSRGTAWSLCA